jgi:glutaminase
MNKELLETILESNRKFTLDGTVANYIPELARADQEQIGIYVKTNSGDYFAGDWNNQFTMQSICKPVMLLLAVLDNGIDFIKAHIGVEATGKPFNAIDYAEPLLLREHINPMVNIGAISVCSMINASSNEERFNRLIDFTRMITENQDIQIDENVFQSEKKTGNKNRALAYLLKNSNMIQGSVEDLLDVYFSICGAKVTCKDLATMGQLLANHGIKQSTGERILPADATRFVNAILTTSGMYDGSGEFATSVGIPAKSGVGGGIMALVPNKMGIGIFSPGLDKKGNSIAGIKMLSQLSKEADLSIF